MWTVCFRALAPASPYRWPSGDARRISFFTSTASALLRTFDRTKHVLATTAARPRHAWGVFLCAVSVSVCAACSFTMLMVCSCALAPASPYRWPSGDARRISFGSSTEERLRCRTHARFSTVDSVFLRGSARVAVPVATRRRAPQYRRRESRAYVLLRCAPMCWALLRNDGRASVTCVFVWCCTRRVSRRDCGPGRRGPVFQVQ